MAVAATRDAGRSSCSGGRHSIIVRMGGLTCHYRGRVQAEAGLRRLTDLGARPASLTIAGGTDLGSAGQGQFGWGLGLGALAGAALGGLLGLLSGVDVITLPGGELLASPPAVSAATGLVIGSGLLGALGAIADLGPGGQEALFEPIPAAYMVTASGPARRAAGRPAQPQ
jgi:hypothetical protein